jgi:acetyl esterase
MTARGAVTIEPIDPGMLMFNDIIASQTPPGSENWPLDQQRAAWNAVCKHFRAPRPANIEVSDVVANGVACRIFTPKTPGIKAGVIYAHGGGWVMGSPDTHDDICAEMADSADCVVVLMDYRLAPEHPHPAQLEDSLKVWRWMQTESAALGVDSNRIIAAGDSAGGQMSIALAMTLRDLGLLQVMAMVLIYPVLGSNVDTPSYHRNANGPCLTRQEMIYYLTSFLGPEGSPAWNDEKAVPLRAATLQGLPPAFITVAGHDPICDDGVQFHERLQLEGIPSTLRHEPTLAHSYMRARNHSAPAKAGFQAIVSALRGFTR